MINSVSKKLNGAVITTLPAYLNYTVTYADGLEIQDNHLLASESLETYMVSNYSNHNCWFSFWLCLFNYDSINKWYYRY